MIAVKQSITLYGDWRSTSCPLRLALALLTLPVEPLAGDQTEYPNPARRPKGLV